MDKPSTLANHLRDATPGELSDMLEALRLERIEIGKDSRGTPVVTIFALRKRHTGPTVTTAVAEMTGVQMVEATVFHRLGLEE
jgi:hypothetical protein